MRQPALIFGMLLTLTTGVWSSALTVAGGWCRHEASAPVASDEHDCCRARIGESNSQYSESPDNSPGATRGKWASQNQVGGSQAGMDGSRVAEAAEFVPRAKATSFDECGLSCFECCANRSGKMPVTPTIVAPEPNQVKRVAGAASASAWYSFASTAFDISTLAPSQHAPPPTAERRHMLISVFLI